MESKYFKPKQNDPHPTPPPSAGVLNRLILFQKDFSLDLEGQSTAIRK